MMSEDKSNKTRLLEDLDNVRRRITELEEAENKSQMAEQDIRNRMDRFRLAVDNARLGVFVVGVQGRFQYLNGILLKRFGLGSMEKAREIDALSFEPFVTGGLSGEIRKCLDVRESARFDGSLEKDRKASSWFHIHLNPMFDSDGSIAGVLGVMSEFTEQRVQTEEMKRKLALEKSMHTLLSGLVGVYDFDDAINRTLASLGELASADRTHLFLLYDNDAMLDNTHEWCAEGVSSRIDKLQNLKKENFSGWIEGLRREPLLRNEGGTDRPGGRPDLGVRKSLIAAVHIKDRIAGFLAYGSDRKDKLWTERDGFLLRQVERIIGDFLERKRLDDTRKQRDQRFRLLAQSSAEGLLIIEKERILDINHNVGVLLGWKPSELIGKPLADLVVEGNRADVGARLKSADGRPFEAGMLGRDGAALSVEMIVKTNPAPDMSQIIVAIRDVSHRTSREEEDRRDLVQTKEALAGTLQALASTVSLRDPFAAGHIPAVEKLCAAIGEKLGIAPDRMEGLLIAARLHDIGKIAVPLEILSKPGPLTPAEQALVQDHPRAGHDMLKNIDFPWPVADIVLQHHERMDGSGYPDGISGNNILLEARILGAADTMEAMLSARSNRPARDIPAVVEELSTKKGFLYDPDVADAALAVIQAPGFRLKK